MSSVPSVFSCGAKLARAKDRYPDDHPVVVEARRNLITAQFRKDIEDRLASCPVPLTDEQIEVLTAVLAGGR